MSKNTASGSRTLLLSVLISSPGPLVMGLGLLAGRSSTQVADFTRRSAELLAIIMSFVIYRITTREDACEEQGKANLERCSNALVGAMLCLGGSFMVLLAFLSDTTDKGNVIPGLAIALLSVLILPNSIVSYWLDFAGSLIVAVYLIWCGVQTILEAIRASKQK